jgi:Phage portal protein
MSFLDRLRRNSSSIAKTDPTINAPMGDPAITAAANAEQMSGNPFAPGVPLSAYRGVNGAPRTWNFEPGYNIKTAPDRDGRISFEMLRRLIDNYSVARACIQHRIDDVRSLEFSIQPRDDNSQDADAAIDAAYRALRKPDGVHTFRAWVAMYLEDVLRYDAGCLIKQRDRAGRYCGLQVVSGITIAPKLDEWGNRPSGNATAFQQYNDGLPWMDFTSDQVIYEPFRPQPDSAYGLAPLEAVLLTANTHMRYQQYWMNWFTEGTVPGGFATLPEDVTSPEQIAQFQEAYDAIHAGKAATKNQIEFMPHGTVFEWPKNSEFNPTFALHLMREVCAAFGVTPNDMGWTEDVNRATGDTQVDVQFRVGTLPLVQHLQDILNGYLQDDLGLPVKFEFDTGQESEDRLATAQAWQIGIEVGAVSPDEMRQELYGKQIDNDQPVPRGLISPRLGFTPWSALLAAAGPINPETMAPIEGADTPVVSLAAANTSPPPAQPIPNAASPEEGAVAKSADVGELAKKELAAFRTFMKSRERSGKWRDFKFTVIAKADADRLNGAARVLVNKAPAPDDATPAGTDASPKVGTPKWREQNPNPTPQQLVDLQITDHYTPDVQAALMKLWSASDLKAAQSATNGLGDVAAGVYQKAVRAVLSGSVRSGDLEAVMQSVWADSYRAGIASARAQVTDVPIKWADWKPGNGVDGLDSAGWHAALEQAQIDLAGIPDTTMDRIGSIIAQGFNNGQDDMATARDIDDVIGDPSRAELISHTETARMLNQASMDTYQELNATQFDLITSADACDDCLDQEAANPHDLDDPDAQVPIHPRCRCSSTPHIDDSAPIDATPDTTGDDADE